MDIEGIPHVAADRPQPNLSPNGRTDEAEQRVILVIDDDMEVLNSIRRTLIREGWVVLTASDPAEGLQSYAAHWQQINLVLLDYFMPGLRGDEVLKRLQHINPPVRVLLMTASDDYVPPRMLNGGLCGFVQKPATRKELIRRIHEALNHHAATGPAPDGQSA